MCTIYTIWVDVLAITFRYDAYVPEASRLSFAVPRCLALLAFCRQAEVQAIFNDDDSYALVTARDAFDLGIHTSINARYLWGVVF